MDVRDVIAQAHAVDVNRIILGDQIVAVVALLTMRSVVKARLKASG